MRYKDIVPKVTYDFIKKKIFLSKELRYMMKFIFFKSNVISIKLSQILTINK